MARNVELLLYLFPMEERSRCFGEIQNQFQCASVSCVPSKELRLFSVTTFSWQMPSLWTRPCYNILSFLSPCVPDAPHADSLSLQRRPAHALLLPDDVARVHCYCVFSEIPGVSVECGIGKAQKVGQDVWPFQKVSKGCLSRPFLCRVPGVE